MRYSYLWLSSLLSKIPQPKEVARLLTLHSYPVDQLVKTGNDWVFDIDIPANRVPDSAGHIGVAREIAAITKTALNVPRALTKMSGEPASRAVSISVDEKTGCRYMASVVAGVKIKPSPRVIQERLISCGLRPINNIVDATNYIMLETGHPVHAFDYDKIAGKKIFVRFANSGETIETLDGMHVALSKNQIVIADTNGPLAIAGVKGGKRAEITPGTKNILLETAVFDSRLVRDTARSTGITTDASSRFSHGLPALMLDEVAERLLGLIQSVAGGVAKKGFVSSRWSRRHKMPISLRRSRIESVIGRDIPEREAYDILVRLGFRVSKKSKDEFLALTPSWRTDIECEEDLIEEVGRIFGYGKVEPRAPHMALLHPEESEEHYFSDKIRSYFRAFGFTEVQNYSFVAENIRSDAVSLELLNPISGDYRYLRSSLAGGIFKNVRDNIGHEKSLKLFEVGDVFRSIKKSPDTHLLFGAVMTGSGRSENLYFEAKGTVESLFAELGITDVWFEDIAGEKVGWPFSPNTVMHPYRAAFCKSDGTTIGVLFEAHPELRLKTPAVVIELSMKELLAKERVEYEFRPLPKYPAVVRDLAILVPKEEKVDDILDIIENAADGLLADVDLFDYYEENAIGEGHKSLAFHLVFQASDRTLTDSEVNNHIEKITKALRREGWEIRS